MRGGLDLLRRFRPGGTLLDIGAVAGWHADAARYAICARREREP